MNRNIFVFSHACFAYSTYLALAILIGVSAISSLGQEPVPRFVEAPCAVAVDGGIAHKCGQLVVYENRRNTDGRTIILPVIIIKSTAEKPEPDPVVYTAGGPGASSMGRARGANHLGPYTDHRDFIIFEQRGTTFANPAMQCPEVPDAMHRAYRLNLSPAARNKAEIDAARQCRVRLAKEGVDLTAYDSAASAADLEDLRRVLGIDRWNLYGVSYSTRLMLNYAREYPGHVRSMILDSVLPPSVNYDETSVDGVVRSLNVLFADCRGDDRCHKAYPDLEREFYSAVSAAHKKPLAVGVEVDGKKTQVYLDGASIVDLVYNLLEDTGALADVPYIIDRIAKGDHRDLRPVQDFARQRLTSRGFVWGMRYSVWCREEMSFESERLVRGQMSKYKRLYGFGIQETFPGICRVWNVPASPALENRPVRTDVPMLVFAGKFDPDTPPAWGRLAASWSPHSYFYEFEGTSHGVLFSRRCAIAEIVPSFLNDPMTRPNDECAASVPRLSYKTADAEAPAN